MASALARGGLVLTSTARAARALQRAHAEQQRDEGQTAWVTPAIEEWAGWLARLRQQYAFSREAPLLLTPMQERALWQRVQDLEGQVVAPERMAELAQDAYRLLSDYLAYGQRRGYGISGWGGHEDSEHFLRWADTFDRTCARREWLPACRSAEMLTEAITQGLLQVPREIVLAGFDRTLPAQERLLEACAAQGAQIVPVPLTGNAEPRVIRALHQRQEMEACAWWARKHLERDGTLRLAILVPDLAPVRGELDRTLRRVLTPAGVEPEAAPLWEFSLGIPLATVPLVKAALLMLAWLGRPLDRGETGWLLSSGFLAGSRAEADMLARVRVSDVALVPDVQLALLVKNRSLPGGAAAALKAVEGFARANLFSSAQRTHAAWAELAQAALRTCGWPGYREADSAAFQARRRWEQLLDQVALLALAETRVGWAEFLRTLETEARGALFSLESEDAPIQVLGAFEASGLQFDALWFLGVDDRRWPAAGQMHPLLPRWLQRAAAMPHATPAADWQLAEEVTRRIAASAPEVVFSHSEREQQVELRPSPLIAALFPLCTAAPAALPPESLWFKHRAAALDQVEDDTGRVAWPREEVAGGSEILKRQAACAFQSFAARRLQLNESPEGSLGLNAVTRGSLLHRVLEQLWSAEAGDAMRLHTLTELRAAIQAGAVPALLSHHIDTVFAREFGTLAGSEDGWAGAYLALERQRLQALLSAWLHCEAERAPFTVAGIERTLPQVAVADLRLSLRVDRVDQLADGSRLLLDYKSGEVSAAKWAGKRPDEPQLPLYLVHGGLGNVSGIAFAQLRPQKFKLVARAERVELLGSAETGKSLLDDATREAWAEALRTLAQDFLRGDAVVNPKRGAVTCRYCRMQALCRVAEAPLSDSEEDDVDARVEDDGVEA